MTEEEIRDRAAQPDSAGVYVGGAVGTSDDVDDGPAFVGPCIGGPWDGKSGESRYPKGFLLVHRPLKQVWIYDFMGGEFHSRTERAEVLDEIDRWRAAEESNYDIRVVAF